jgi:hypothetical protein
VTEAFSAASVKKIATRQGKSLLDPAGVVVLVRKNLTEEA